MTVKYKDKSTGKVVEGLLVTGDPNDTVGIVVWLDSLGFNSNQVSSPVLGGGTTVLPKLADSSGPVAAGSLIWIENGRPVYYADINAEDSTYELVTE